MLFRVVRFIGLLLLIAFLIFVMYALLTTPMFPM